MQHTIPHDLPIETARKATRAALESYRREMAEYSPEGEWVNDNTANVRFTAAGTTMKGTVVVQPTQIVLSLDVPFLLRPFKGIALRVIEGEIQQWLRRARAGEFDDGDPR